MIKLDKPDDQQNLQMIKMSRNVSQICIGLPSKAGDVHQFGRMLCDALSEIGLRPIQVEDGSPLVLQSEALLLIGDCHSFDGFAQLLGNIPGSRPTTILWQIDPLPPINLTAQAEKVGEEAFQRLSRHRRTLRYKAINACLTRAMRQKRKQALYKDVFRDFKEQMARILAPACKNQRQALFQLYSWTVAQIPPRRGPSPDVEIGNLREFRRHRDAFLRRHPC